MTINTIFDSNIWIASYVPEDSTHDLAKSILAKHKGQFYLTENIISEVITVLKRLKELEGAKEFVRAVLHVPDFVVIPTHLYFNETINYFLKSNDEKLSFTDMSLVVLSKKYKVVTLDKALSEMINDK